MAKTQIGAVIGVEGAKEYQRQLALLTQYTKEWASETDKLTSSFDKNFKSMKDVNNQRASLQREIDSMNKKLQHQQGQWEEIATTMNGMPTDKQQQAMSQLRTEINQTETQLNDLYNTMNNLPADNFIGSVDLIRENIRNSESDVKKWGELFEDVGKKLSTYVTLPIIAGFTASASAAVDWESSLNGVRKTTNMSEEEISTLASSLKEMALETTYSSNELANVAQIAGQLGVRGVDDISKFVQVVSDLGISTDLSAEDAATALARIFNITEGGSLDNIERIGSVIVHLGNNMATTEPEIVAMANRMASAASTAGLTTQEIFALSAALSSVGITAEAGGSTIGQVLTKIGLEIDTFSAGAESNLEKIAEISGMSATEFADTWKNEPVKAFEAFVTGLGNLGEESESVNQILDELGMAGIRESNMLKAMAQAQEEGVDTTQLLSKSLELMEEAYNGVNSEGEQFNALQQEADVRKKESATQFANLKESVVQLGQAFGEVLLPLIIPLVQGLTDMITALANLDTPTKVFITTVLGILAALGPVLTMVGTGLQLFNALSVAAKTLEMTAGALALSIGKWVAIGGAVVIAIGAIVAAIVWLKEHSEQIMIFWEGAKEGFIFIAEAVKFAWEEGCKLIAQWFSDMVQKIQNKVTEMKSNLVNKFNEIKSSIGNTFRNLISSAYSWGKDLIGNIVSGITSKVSSLISSVKNIASTIWSYLHFSEPEKGALSDFHTWMPDFMKGLAQGIDDNMYLIDQAAENIANHLGMGGDSYNYGGVVINLNVPQGANGYQLVDEIETALAQRTVRRKAVFA